MIKTNQKSFLAGILLLLAVCAQVTMIVLNLFETTDQNNYAMYILNYVIGLLILCTLILRGIREHFLAIAFFACFLVFLMGQKPFKPEYDVFLTFTRTKLDTNQYFTFSCILFMGLAVTYYSYSLFSYYQRNRARRDDPRLFYSEIDSQALKPLLTMMLCVTLPCALYMQGKIVLVRSGMEYTSGYLINVDVPAIIKAGYYVYSTIILLYLALKPIKRQLVFVLGTYIIVEGGLQLFQGRRALFASTVLFILWYLLKYNDNNDLQKVKKQNILRLGAVVVGLAVLFFVVEQARDSSSTALTTRMFQKLMISTGGSDSVIANTIYRKDQFPASGLAYLLDPLINNPIGNLITGNTSVGQGMEYLQQHNSFSHWISYITQPSLYLSGHGLGSCYLAEVYLAFGKAHNRLYGLAVTLPVYLMVKRQRFAVQRFFSTSCQLALWRSSAFSPTNTDPASSSPVSCQSIQAVMYPSERISICSCSAPTALARTFGISAAMLS